MIRELRRRLLLRAHSAAQRFFEKNTATHFMECDNCRSKPGSPLLCAGCLNNRAVIGAADDVFVAGWLFGYRTARRDRKKFQQRIKA